MKGFIEKNSTLEVARFLLGKKIITRSDSGETSGIIVETEAYLHDDPASHSFNGITKRNRPMFEKPGTIYVYQTYGIHHCFNIVTNKKEKGEAVLIRAIEPVSGLDLMKRRRKTDILINLTNGPAKLVSALGITKSKNNQSIFSKKSGIKLSRGIKPREIVATTRIGISKAKEKPHRFYIKGNRFVSKK